MKNIQLTLSLTSLGGCFRSDLIQLPKQSRQERHRTTWPTESGTVSSRSSMGGVPRNSRAFPMQFSDPPLRDFPAQPGPGVGPEPLGCPQCYAERSRSLLHCHAREIAQLHE